MLEKISNNKPSLPIEVKENYTINCPTGECIDVKILDKRLFTLQSRSLVELDSTTGEVKTAYQDNTSTQGKNRNLTFCEPMHDGIRERYIVVSDGYNIKFWNINKSEILISIPGPTTSLVGCSSKGEFLSALLSDHCIRIFANEAGHQRVVESLSSNSTSSTISETLEPLSPLAQSNKPTPFVDSVKKRKRETSAGNLSSPVSISPKSPLFQPTAPLALHYPSPVPLQSPNVVSPQQTIPVSQSPLPVPLQPHITIPVYPTKISQPTSPVLQTENPFLSSNPVIPMQQPVQSTTPVQPTIPVQSTIPVQPTIPVQSTTPVSQTVKNPFLSSFIQPIESSTPVQYASPVQPVIPVQSATPVQPVIPIQPVIPMQPLAPVQSTTPMQSLTPVIPMQPLTPVQSKSHVYPVIPVLSTTPQPVIPMQPLTPVQYTTPMQSLTPVQSTTHVYPVTPVQSTTPVQPVQSATPIQHVIPVNLQPWQPPTCDSPSVIPVQPVTPTQPAKSVIPVQPVTPVQNVASAQPATPVQSVIPIQPAIPVQPVIPVKIVSPVPSSPVSSSSSSAPSPSSPSPPSSPSIQTSQQPEQLTQPQLAQETPKLPKQQLVQEQPSPQTSPVKQHLPQEQPPPQTSSPLNKLLVQEQPSPSNQQLVQKQPPPSTSPVNLQLVQKQPPPPTLPVNLQLVQKQPPPPTSPVNLKLVQEQPSPLQSPTSPLQSPTQKPVKLDYEEILEKPENSKKPEKQVNLVQTEKSEPLQPPPTPLSGQSTPTSPTNPIRPIQSSRALHPLSPQVSSPKQDQTPKPPEDPEQDPSSTESLDQKPSNDNVPDNPVPKEHEKSRNLTIIPIDNIIELMVSGPRSTYITRLIFSHRGNSLMATNFYGTNQMWRWKLTPDGKLIPEIGVSTLSMAPKWSDPKPDIRIPQILSLSTNDSFLVCSNVGSLELYNNIVRSKMTVLYDPTESQCVPTAFAFNPSDNNFFVIGLHNGNIILKALKQKRGWERHLHDRPITDLCFARTLKDKGMLITSARDGNVSIWQYSTPSIVTTGQPPPAAASGGSSNDFTLLCLTSFYVGTPTDTYIHLCPSSAAGDSEAPNFVVEQPQLLELHSLDGKKLHQWIPSIDQTVVAASYDCDGCFVYALMSNSTLIIFSDDLTEKGKLKLPRPYTAIATNPKDQQQIALGDSEGCVSIVKFNLKTLY